ncbi:MAG TPA: ATP-binding cassette domain-containing protein [Gammaproteobacteria bacterium]|nr:ATP-binding cassette domain-containing protein [Gammaproteobacteria bacterium]
MRRLFRPRSRAGRAILNAPVVTTHSLTKVYAGAPVVDCVDVSIDRGECWGLLGPNGAGKTTFLRMLVGRTPPTSGDIVVLGHPIPRQASAMRARIGVVPQLDNLDPDFTVNENLRTYAGYFGIDPARLKERIRDLLEFAALSQKADAYLATLSGGMLRRLSLIRALVNAPELLVLDEPTTGLDPQARQLIWQRLRSLRSEGITQILTTHYMEEAERLCDRVTVMDHGRLLDAGHPRALVRRHIEPHVIEVHGEGLQRWHEETASRLAPRHEHAGDGVLYYLEDERPLLEALSGHGQLSFLHRPANLEDVFLKLTGRELRDG